MVLAENVCTYSSFPTGFGILGASWVELCVLALVSSTMLLVLAHLLATFLKNDQLLAWTKFETFQVLGTAVIFMLTGVIVIGMCDFDMSFLDKSSDRYVKPNGEFRNMFEIAEKYLKDVENIGKLLFAYLMWVVRFFNLLSRITWTSQPIGVGSADAPLESLAQVNSLFFYMVGGFVSSFLLLSLQMRMLEYISVAVLFYLYPFGLFFRSFEPTRLFGGALIGLSISLFLFYPIMLVFNDYIMHSGEVKFLDHVEGGLNNVLDTAQGQVKYGVAKNLNANVGEGKLTDIAERNVLSNLTGGISNGLIFLLRPLLIYFIAAVVLPVINFIVLVETTRALTAFFGEELDVTNLTRMI